MPAQKLPISYKIKPTLLCWALKEFQDLASKSLSCATSHSYFRHTLRRTDWPLQENALLAFLQLWNISSSTKANSHANSLEEVFPDTLKRRVISSSSEIRWPLFVLSKGTNQILTGGLRYQTVMGILEIKVINLKKFPLCLFMHSLNSNLNHNFVDLISNT